MQMVFDSDRLLALAEQARAAYATAMPFPHCVLDDFLPIEAAERLAQVFPEPERDVAWQQFSVSGFEVKLASNAIERLPEAIASALLQFNSGPFLRFLERLTGIEHLLADPHLAGGGVHLIGKGGHLGVHADFNWHPGIKAHRRINFLLYLNHDWRPEYHGELELWSTDATRMVKSVTPLFNRAVIFNTRSDTFHGHPVPLEVPDGVYRRSLALYYYSSERPQHELMEAHSTRYKGYHIA